MATREEQGLDAVNAKVDAILAHLGLTVDTADDARKAAEAKAGPYWAQGGEGWLSIHGKPPEEDEDGDAAEANRKSIVATEQQRQAELFGAAKAQAEADAQAAQDTLDEQQRAIAAQAEAIGQREAERAEEIVVEEEEEVETEAPAAVTPRNNRGRN